MKRGHFKGLMCMLIALAMLVSVPGSAFAQADLASVITKLNKIEAENKALKADLNAMGRELSAVKTNVGTTKTGLPADNSIQLYGYIKADAIYEDSQGGDFVTNVAPETQANRDNDEFNISVRQTRLGLKFKGPELPGDGQLNAKIETDFWGTGTGGTHDLRLRQAYIQLKYPTWDIIAGQAWDFFSVMSPATLDFGAMWDSGNIGDRHPQVIVSKRFDDILGGKITLKAAALDSNVASQENTGEPIFGGSVIYDGDICGKPLHLGYSAFYGQTETSPAHDSEIYASTLGLKLGLTEKLSVAAEAYIGEDLDPFRSTATGVQNSKAIQSRGGWVQLTYKATDKITLNGGAGIDDVITDGATTGTTQEVEDSYTYFANVTYKLAKNVILGLEYEHKAAEYNNGTNAETKGDLNRFQTSLIYKF